MCLVFPDKEELSPHIACESLHIWSSCPGTRNAAGNVDIKRQWTLLCHQISDFCLPFSLPPSLLPALHALLLSSLPSSLSSFLPCLEEQNKTKTKTQQMLFLHSWERSTAARHGITPHALFSQPSVEVMLAFLPTCSIYQVGQVNSTH